MNCFLTMLVCIFATMALADGAGRLYQWTVKREFTSPEVYKKLSITINGKSPGPTILAHQGDALIIKVTNGLGKENLAVQWENGKAVAQGPILPGKTTRFRFVANWVSPVYMVGTFQYYALSKLQREAGPYGWIRVLPPGAGTGVCRREKVLTRLASCLRRKIRKRHSKI